MSDAATAALDPGSERAPETSPARLYVRLWADALAEVLGKTGGAASPVMLGDAPAPPPPAAADDLLAVIAAEGGLRGEMSLRLSRPLSLQLAQMFVGEPQEAAVVFGGEHREALQEWLRQVAGVAASAMKARWGEVALRVELAEQPPSWASACSGWLLGAASPLALQVEWQLSAALHAALLAAAGDQRKPEAPGARAATAGPLDLLLDVELGVTLRFGSRRLLLREVLELAAGSVLALDRQLQEPAELLLEGRVIARGEVVIVDGNYGLRVQQVVYPRAEQET